LFAVIDLWNLIKERASIAAGSLLFCFDLSTLLSDKKILTDLLLAA